MNEPWEENWELENAEPPESIADMNEITEAEGAQEAPRSASAAEVLMQSGAMIADLRKLIDELKRRLDTADRCIKATADLGGLAAVKVTHLLDERERMREAQATLRDNILNDPDRDNDTINWALGHIDTALHVPDVPHETDQEGDENERSS